MILSIAVKEFYNNLVSARFMIGFILCLVLIPFSVVVGIQEYRSRTAIYQVELKRAEDSTQVYIWSAYRPEVVRPPDPLSILSRGISGNIGNRVRVQRGEVPAQSSGRVSVRDNPFLNGILTLDFATVLAMLMSLLALMFAYDVCTGEKEEGTLKLMLSNPVSRSVILAGKGFGILLTLLPIMLFCYLLGALIMLLYPGVALGGTDWMRITVLALTSIVYFTVWVALGMLISSRSRSSVTAIVLALFVWVVLVFIIPNGAVYAARSFVTVGSQENLRLALQDIDRERDETMEREASTISRDGLLFMHLHNHSSGGDGYHELIGAERRLYEFYRRGHEIEEPIRVDYADRKWAVQQAYLDELHRQATVARAIGMLSPVTLFKQATEVLCRTDARAHDSFMETARRYREAVLDYFNAKQVYGSYLWFTPIDPETFLSADELITVVTDGRFSSLDELILWMDASDDPFSVLVKGLPEWDDDYPLIDVSDAPVFDWRPDTLGASLVKSAGGLGGMLFEVLLLFFLSFVSFTRFDVR
jgi:ABC-type transport system involved in multi-copper enzyme maturation permease subunit